MQASDPLSTTFAALADPTRRAILARLAEGEASVGELAAPFEMSLPAVSKHLKVLERAALIRRTKVAQWRRCALRADGFRDAARWLEHYERFWRESLDRLADYLEEHDDEPDQAAQHAGRDPTAEDTDGDGSTKAR
jgi:DNA-binding transcriptional ArsR family regulator